MPCCKSDDKKQNSCCSSRCKNLDFSTQSTISCVSSKQESNPVCCGASLNPEKPVRCKCGSGCKCPSCNTTKLQSYRCIRSDSYIYIYIRVFILQCLPSSLEEGINGILQKNKLVFRLLSAVVNCILNTVLSSS